MKRSVLSCFLLMLSLWMKAQQVNYFAQAAADIRLVNEAYVKSDKLKMDVSYMLFPGYTSLMPFESDKGVFMRQGDNTFSDLLGITSLRNSKVSLTVDSNEQTIIVADPPTKDDKNPSLVNLDSLLKKCSAIEFHQLQDGMKFYKLKFENTLFFEYNAIDIYIDPKTNFLAKLVLYFRMDVDLDDTDDNQTKDRPRLEVSYSEITTSPVFPPGQFSEAAYISMSGKKINSTSSYASYRLLNHKLH